MPLHRLRNLLRSSFSTRVLAYILVATVPLLMVFNLVFLFSQQKSLQAHIVDQGDIMVRMLANNVRLGVFAENRNMLKGPMGAALDEEGVIEAAVYTLDGILLYRQSRHGGTRHDLSFPDREARQQLSVGVKPPYMELEERFVFWAPVLESSAEYAGDDLHFGRHGFKESNGSAIGMVGIVMDKTLLREGLKTILVRNFVVVAVFLVIAFLAAFLVMREVTRPLHSLVASIRKREINVESTDEMGFLENTFDALVDQLGNTFETINGLRKGLEEKVLELKWEVSERRQAEQALRESEETARVLLNAPTHLAVLIDRDGIVLDINESMAKTLGKEARIMTGSRFWDLFPADEVMQQRRFIFDRVLQKGESIRFEDERQGNWYDNVVFPVQDRDGDGRVSKVAILARNITGRVKAERQRRDLEVKTLAQSKLASLGEIATGIAHEINQPLSFIKVVYECTLRDLDRGQLDIEELQEDCGEALRQIGRITSIVNHLRAFGRSDSMSVGPVQLETVLQNTMILMSERIKLRNISFASDFEHDLPAVCGNDIKLEQVFINLLQNSIDALSGADTAEIHISARLSGDAVEIRVADNGPGVPPEIAERIFEPFFTTKEVGEGTGLGLSIVYSIVKEHLGTMRLESMSPHGTAFVITLPVWREEREEINACDTEGNMQG